MGRQNIDITVGIRELKQNPSKVLQDVEYGNNVIISNHGKPVAQITRYEESYVDKMIRTGEWTAPTESLADVLRDYPPAPSVRVDGLTLTELLIRDREEERY